MTQNWITAKNREASTVDPVKRHWVNQGLESDIDISRIARLLGLKHADVTAIYYADGHWKETE